MGKPQNKRQAHELPARDPPTKKRDTKDPNNKSAEDSPSTAQTPGTPPSKNTVKLPETPQPTAPTTPKMPTSAKLLGTKKATATTVRHHATASNTALHRMLERLMETVMENQPQSVEEKKSLLEALAQQLVNTVYSVPDCWDPALLERKTFSMLTKSEWDRICEQIQLNYKGAIEFSTTKELLETFPNCPNPSSSSSKPQNGSLSPKYEFFFVF